MAKKNAFFIGFGLFFIAIAVWQIASAQKGLDVITINNSDPPVTIITSSDSTSTPRPTVLIAHGLAGSSVIMRGFALTLAHAGYTTVSWDFQGHGANPNPLSSSSHSSDLLHDAESALAYAEAAGLADTQRVAILGHSMGSGAALSYGTSHPKTSATIAISPVNQPVTPALPQNLLLMAGSLETQFVSNAERLLALAGGQGGELSSGTARKLVVIPDVEHISILFSPKAHLTARLWLDGTFGSQSGASNYVDRRIFWFVLGILGVILFTNACLNMISSGSEKKITIKPLWHRMIAVFMGGIIATILLWLISLSGFKVNQVLGFLVGGFLIFWFGIAGLTSLLLLRPQIYKPSRTELIKSLIAFSALWLGVGLLGHFVWLPWLLIPSRLWLWIPSSLILVPWYFAIGSATAESKPVGLFGWWIFQVISILISLFLAIRLIPVIGFLILILPLVPVIIGIHMLMISSKHGVWAYALSGAMFTSWLILAVFPLQ